MVEPRNWDLACHTEANAEDGPYYANIVSSGLESSYGS